jgi:hypothetical protein
MEEKIIQYLEDYKSGIITLNLTKDLILSSIKSALPKMNQSSDNALDHFSIPENEIENDDDLTPTTPRISDLFKFIKINYAKMIDGKSKDDINMITLGLIEELHSLLCEVRMLMSLR